MKKIALGHHDFYKTAQIHKKTPISLSIRTDPSPSGPRLSMQRTAKIQIRLPGCAGRSDCSPDARAQRRLRSARSSTQSNQSALIRIFNNWWNGDKTFRLSGHLKWPISFSESTLGNSEKKSRSNTDGPQYIARILQWLTKTTSRCNCILLLVDIARQYAQWAHGVYKTSHKRRSNLMTFIQRRINVNSTCTTIYRSC